MYITRRWIQAKDFPFSDVSRIWARRSFSIVLMIVDERLWSPDFRDVCDDPPNTEMLSSSGGAEAAGIKIPWSAFKRANSSSRTRIFSRTISSSSCARRSVADKMRTCVLFESDSAFTWLEPWNCEVVPSRGDVMVPSTGDLLRVFIFIKKMIQDMERIDNVYLARWFIGTRDWNQYWLIIL